ncbi:MULTISPECIES: ParA family protein [Catenuloplanes]|uniref:Cellulose biosynthesis protein BcsQ n=1 Tax=Catenuloplanes niger TaxID=587534 RepID=A0AAE3ZMD8_9ACTN|nr:ParA family protein [Catenuloplanes niger]MDR7321396.1 cellulose biosynthesis protein BcsQ [Catenuloplanes niger]
MHDCLANALQAPEFRDYDLIMIDCPPNFGLVTKTAIVASDYLLVPAKPDYLSTLGIGYMVTSLNKLVKDFNKHASHQSENWGPRRPIAPRIAGIAFTMTQHQIGRPINAQRNQIELVRAQGLARVLQSTIRNNPKYFSEAGENGIPAVLRGSPVDPLTVELRELTEEFLASLSEKG